MKASRHAIPRAAVALLMTTMLCGLTGPGAVAAAGPEPTAPGERRGGESSSHGPLRHSTGVDAPAVDAAATTAQLDIRVVDRSGNLASSEQASYVLVFDVADRTDYTVPLVDGTATVEVPPGIYSLATFVRTPEADGSTSKTLAVDPIVEVAADTTVTLDASRATRPIDVRVDRRDARPTGGIVLYSQPSAQPRERTWYAFDAGPAGRSYVTPTETVPGARLHVYSAFTRNGAEGSPYSYHLVDTARGRVPAAPTFVHRTRDLATLQSTVAAQGEAGCGRLRPSTRLPGEDVGMGLGTVTGLTPGVHTSYHTPGPQPWRLDLSYTSTDCDFSQDVADYFVTNRTFPAAGRYTERWHTAPLGPAVAGYNVLAAPDGLPAWLSPAHRAGDQIEIAVPLLVDGGAAHYGEASPWWPAPGTSGSTTLSRNGEVIGLSDLPGIESITVDPERATYRLDVSQTRSVPWSDLATAQQVSWTFASEHAEGPEPDALPLLAVRYDLDLDDQGRAPAGQRYQFGVRVESWPGAPVGEIEDLAVQASYDDGATWHDVPLTAAADGWTASVTHPSGSGYVSLRAHARDDLGNSVDQTVIRGYGLAG